MLPVREVDPAARDVVLVPLPFQIVQTPEFAASVPTSWKKDTQSPLFFIGDLLPFEAEAALSFQTFVSEKITPPLATFLQQRETDDWKRRSTRKLVHAQATEACMLTESRGDQSRTLAVLRTAKLFLLVKLDYDGTLGRAIGAQFRQVVDSVVFTRARVSTLASSKVHTPAQDETAVVRVSARSRTARRRRRYPGRSRRPRRRVRETSSRR